jgi:hypothetical protein
MEKTMKFIHAGFAFALCTFALGCSNDASASQPTDVGDGIGSDADGEPPLSADGRYLVRSRFDLARHLPGNVGIVVDVILSATDDANDPVGYIYDRVVDGMSDGIIKSALRAAGPLVTGYLNDRILEVAPDFVPRMVVLGHRFGQLARTLGTISELRIASSSWGTFSTHIVNGVEFTLSDSGVLLERQFRFVDHGIADIRADHVVTTLDPSGELSIDPHIIAVSFGQLMKIGLDEMIIPLLDREAHNLNELLRSLVDCHQVGLAVFTALHLGTVATFESACSRGLDAGADFIYDKIADIDSSALQLELSGFATAVDRNRDGATDDLEPGIWTGTVRYATTPVPLGTATFTGRRQ